MEFYYVSHKQGRARLYRPPLSLRVVECNCASEAGSRTIGIGCIWVFLPPRVLLVIFSIGVAQEGQCGSPTPGRANFQLCFRSLEQTLGGLPQTKPKWSAICLKQIREIGTSGVFHLVFCVFLNKGDWARDLPTHFGYIAIREIGTNTNVSPNIVHLESP